MVKKVSNEKIFEGLVMSGKPRLPTIRYLLRCEGADNISIAADSGVSPSVVSRTLSGEKINKKVVKTIAALLGFNPFA